MKIKVGVIFGGNSVEHEVSIITAVQAMSFMDTEKYDIIPIYITKDRQWYTGKMLLEMDVYKDFDSLKKYAKQVCLTNINGEFCLQNTKGLFRKTIEKIDIAFPIVHGKGVEDGSLEGYLESIGIPTVGPSILGAALGQDKIVMKQVLDSYKIANPEYTWFYDFEYLENKEEITKRIEKLKYPVIVKPARLGSSVGIKIAKDKQSLDIAIEEAIKYDSKILVEKVIEDLKEVNCAVLGNSEYQETSLIALMKTKNDFLTYEDKYLSGGKKKTGLKGLKSGNMSTSEFDIPAKIDKDLEEEIKDLAKKTFKALDLSGVARIDFLIDNKNKKVYVNEPNTIPGSLSFYLFKPAGKDYKTLLDEMITTAIKKYKEESKKVSSFESNILSTYNGSKGMKGKI
ncbi:MAG: D-alanine--D-alanine ligase [Bacilli bacterium]|nr:D-alanine--D-alanine ligase [Bacilli bacterium]